MATLYLANPNIGLTISKQIPCINKYIFPFFSNLEFINDIANPYKTVFLIILLNNKDPAKVSCVKAEPDVALEKILLIPPEEIVYIVIIIDTYVIIAMNL